MPTTPDQETIFTLTTGPVDAYPEVLRGLSKPVLYDYDPAFLSFYERVNEKLRAAFRTPHMPVILQGEPVLGAGGEHPVGFGRAAIRYADGIDGRAPRGRLQGRALGEAERTDRSRIVVRPLAGGAAADHQPAFARRVPERP